MLMKKHFYKISLMGMLMVHSFMVSLAISSSNVTDISALLAFKSEIVGSNWTETENFCNWVGVTCSHRRQRVTGHLRRLEVLILEGNLLEGAIPASIHHCQKLKVISLSKNGFVGVIPKELSFLSSLRHLFLGRNNLTGTIPPSLVNNSKLEWLGLEQNYLQGSIPNEIGNLQNLQQLSLSQNGLTGLIPPSIFNISSLRGVSLSFNSLSGTLPSSLGLWLPNLVELDLGGNQLSGNIPLCLSNSSYLKKLRLSSNQFSGPVLTSLGHLEHLVELDLAGNQLTSQSGSLELSFLTALTGCKSLEKLSISNNPLNGLLPESVGNLSSSLQMFVASSCQIKGPIPKGIGSLKILNRLELSNNHLNGTIPSTVKGMKSLQRLHIGGNRLEENIPNEICLLTNLGEVELQNNNLSGSIPSCIGNLIHLQIMDLSSNSLSSSIPSSLWSLENILFMNLSCNSLHGSLNASMGAFNLKMLESIDLSWNRISGNIPTIFGAFESLSSLNLSRNSFGGPIPESLGGLITLDFMDLSQNNLSGAIPKSLEALSHLQYLNLSVNNLSGEIPSRGPFENFTATSFLENGALCGQAIFQVPPCRSHGPRNSKSASLLKYILPTLASAAILVALIRMMMKNRRCNARTCEHLVREVDQIISYEGLCQATDDFSEANIIGVGGFGSVFKGILNDKFTVAIKVLNLQLEGALAHFNAEFVALRNVRHRNLVKLICSCSETELGALVLPYMPNGSLEKWLYSENYCLNLFQRVSIMVDVASALEYLHHGLPDPVVHCDLNPSNVLLDNDMVAHVGDFGIAKILTHKRPATRSITLGTLGYVAPEHGMRGRVSTRTDVYSYGIMLLGMLTGKKPTDDMFSGELTLRQWVTSSISNKIMEVIDRKLLKTEDGGHAIATNCNLLAIFKLGLECSRELPQERIDIKEVVIKLDQIKWQMTNGN
ncbi:hypothetical protein AAG906_020107 [Vitis piasezkii]